MTQAIEETIGRAAILALANNYPRMTDALMEIIDNPFDYRRGKKLTVHVSVEKKQNSPGSIAVLDTGGEGMDANGLRDWIQWGTGHEHSASDIGQYHVGGKLACVYLAESLQIVCRKAGTQDIHRFNDPKWGSRTEPYVGHVESIDTTAAAWTDSRIADLDEDVGFTFIKLTGLKDHRYERTLLLERLASTYRSLILSGVCEITLDDELVEPLQIPESATHAAKAVAIPRVRLAPGVFVEGRVWIMDRDRIPQGRGVSVKAGIRTLFNGRLITQGEEFGHYLGGKGSLQRLIGEIHLTGLKPTADKSKWLVSDPHWETVSDFMHENMQPIVAFLNNLSESRPVPREQRKRTEAVRRDLAEAFKRISQNASLPPGQLGTGEGQAGRKQPQSREQNKRSRRDKNEDPSRRNIRNRTPAPVNAVGSLLRKTGGNIPKIDYEPLGQGERSLWGEPNVTLVINTDHPLYSVDSDRYLVETICLHLLKEDETFRYAPILDTLDQLDRIVWTWAEVVDSGS